jgi:hypothetical protein
MSELMMYERFLDKGKKPNKQEIEKSMGNLYPLWIEIDKYIEEKYDFTKELIFFTKKYGWSIKYRKSGRTMLYLFPEQGAFSALIVLGKKESETVNSMKDQLSEGVKKVFDITEQLHDGRWLWVRILTDSDLNSLKLLLKTKAKPKK